MRNIQKKITQQDKKKYRLLVVIELIIIVLECGVPSNQPKMEMKVVNGTNVTKLNDRSQCWSSSSTVA